MVNHSGGNISRGRNFRVWDQNVRWQTGKVEKHPVTKPAVFTAELSIWQTHYITNRFSKHSGALWKSAEQTDADDIKRKSLRNGLIHKLIGETIEANVSMQWQWPHLCLLLLQLLQHTLHTCIQCCIKLGRERKEKCIFPNTLQGLEPSHATKLKFSNMQTYGFSVNWDHGKTLASEQTFVWSCCLLTISKSSEGI